MSSVIGPPLGLVMPQAIELAREYRATLENIVESRGIPQVAEFSRGGVQIAKSR